MPPKSSRAVYITLALIVLAGLSAAYIYLHLRAARLVSEALTSALGQPVTVSMVGFRPETGLTLYNLEIKNPPGYATPYLLNIKAVNVKPAYRELLKGRMVLDMVGAYYPALYLEQARDKAWNFQPVIDGLKKKKPRKFTLTTLDVKNGRVLLPARGIELAVPAMGVKDLSSIDPVPAGFGLTVKDGKGMELTGSGTVSVFSRRPAVKAGFVFKGVRLYNYYKPPEGVDLHGSSLDAKLEVGYDGNTLSTRLDGSLTGVTSAYYKGGGPLDAMFKAEADYMRDTDSLAVKKAELGVFDIGWIGFSGVISEPLKPGAYDIAFKASPMYLTAGGLSVTDTEGTFRYKDQKAELEFYSQVAGGSLKVKAGAGVSGGHGLINPYLSGNLEGIKLTSLKPAFERFELPVSPAGGTVSLSFSLSGEDLDRLAGPASVRLAGLGLDRGGRPFIRGVSGEFRPSYGKKAFVLPETEVRFGGSFRLRLAGAASFQKKGWSARASLRLPDTDVSSLQEGVLEALPAKLKWADVAGRAGLKADLELSSGGTGRLSGSLGLKGARLDLPDDGISVGPADGSVPLDFVFGGKRPKTGFNPFRQERFDRDSYKALLKKYSKRPGTAGLIIKKASYGFVEMDDIALDIRPGPGYYEVAWFGLRCFGGRVYGYGAYDLTGGKGTRHALSLMLSDFSLREICNRAPAIKGYLSGLVDGLVRVQLSGKGYEGVAGAGIFWTRDGPDEDREISRQFLKKLMGQSFRKYMFIGDRSFDTGEMDVIFSGGDLVFDKLVISHTNFLGIRDLMVGVAPVSNKIALEHLLEVVREVKERAGGI